MSAVSRLVSSPVRRSAKKPGDIAEQPAEQVPPQPGHHPLSDRAQQIGLREVEQGLDAEEPRAPGRWCRASAGPASRTRRPAGNARPSGRRGRGSRCRAAPGSPAGAVRGRVAPAEQPRQVARRGEATFRGLSDRGGHADALVLFTTGTEAQRVLCVLSALRVSVVAQWPRCWLVAAGVGGSSGARSRVMTLLGTRGPPYGRARSTPMATNSRAR